MIDKPDNGTNTGFRGNGDPCNLAGILERTPPVPHQPRSSVVRLPLTRNSSLVVGKTQKISGARGVQCSSPGECSNPMTEAVTPRKRHRSSYMREYRARQTALRSADGLLPYQREFLAAVTRRENRPEIAALLSWSWEWKNLFGGCPVGKGAEAVRRSPVCRGGRIGTCIC